MSFIIYSDDGNMLSTLKYILGDLRDALNGKKTIIVGVAMVLYGLSGGLLGELDPANAIEITLEGLGLICLRFGLIKRP